MGESDSNSPLWQLFIRLRRRRFLLGIEDYFALKQAMAAGFGWSSREALLNLCCSLWAKSNSEREIVTALFDQIELPEWDLTQDKLAALPSTEGEIYSLSTDPDLTEEPSEEDVPVQPLQIDKQVPATQPKRGLPPINLDAVQLPDKSFVFVPHFPLTTREVAQLCRHLREPELSGPPEDLDVDATIALRCRQGITGPLVLSPRKRSTSRLLLLIDRQGSMAPFHRLVEMVSDAIIKATRSGDVAVYYFHDVPVEGGDDRILASVQDQPFPAFDGVLHQIAALNEGHIYEDKELLSPVPLINVLQSFAANAAVMLLSDAGAARRRYDPQRLLDTIGFIKALQIYTRRYIWLNPLPCISWEGSTAAQIARYIPMFPLDFENLNHAILTLRGQRRSVENHL